MPPPNPRPPDAPGRLAVAATVSQAFGSEEVYERVIARLRRRGVAEADVERHNLFFAVLVEGEVEQARAITGRVVDAELRRGLREHLGAYQESFVAEALPASELA